jgi:tetratricopeptide (TPR) repeat protein
LADLKNLGQPFFFIRNKMKYEDFLVQSLGKAKVTSPLKNKQREDSPVYKFINEDERILYDSSVESFMKCKEAGNVPISFEKAGPRENIFFEPAKTKVGIVTCGGLCPGLNNVIRSLVNELYYRYGISRILGFKYGYEGLVSKYNHPVIELTPQMVRDIHMIGGTFLGTSRGNQDVCEMVDTLEILNISILYCIGGDGTLRGAHAIHEEIKRRNLKIAVAGIPKTIDNDIDLIQKSFGFETAFSIANDIIRNAHNEASGAYNGIALVKLMGRDSGFIAASASIYRDAGEPTRALQEVDAALGIRPGSADALNQRGMLLGGAGKSGEAAAAFERAAAASPRNPQFWYNLGLARFRAGDRLAAAVALRRALSLKPDFAEAKTLLAEAGKKQ